MNLSSPIREPGISVIDCIAIPTTERENGDLAILFACWLLLHGCDKIADRLLITFPGDAASNLLKEVETLIRLFSIESLFARIDIKFLSIPKEDDVYIKDCTNWKGPVPRLGYKSGPNLQFFRTLKAARDSRFTFLNETDVLPLDPLWLSRLAETLRDRQDWVLGSNYKGDTILGADIIGHINGAAVYSTGDSRFQEFCDQHWEPGVERMCKDLPDTAYDIWLSRMQHKISSEPNYWPSAEDSFRRFFADALSRFTVTDAIANLTLSSDFRSVLMLKEQGFILAHGKHFKYPAFEHAINRAGEYAGQKLSRIQCLSIASRCKNSPESVLALQACVPESMVGIAKKLDQKARAKKQIAQTAQPLPNKIIEITQKKSISELPATSLIAPVQLFPKLSDICIFTRSYIGDASLLPGLYSSIEENFKHVAECILVIEEQDYDDLSKVVPGWVKICAEKKFAPGTIQHKYSKLTADLHTSCDWIFHIDSDTLVSSQIDTGYLLRDGKPIIEITSYEQLRTYQEGNDFKSHMSSYVLEHHLPQELQKEGVKDAECWIREHYSQWFDEWFPKWKYTFGLDVWQEGTSYAFGSQIDLEFSQKPIKLYPRQIYPVCREHIQAVHSMNLPDFILTRVGRQSYGISRNQYFSDLNFIGACLYYYFHDSVHWIRTDIDGFDYRDTRFEQRISYDILNRT